MASSTKADTIAQARALIALATPASTPQKHKPPDNAAPDKPAQACPCCGGRMLIIETFARGTTPRYRPNNPDIRIDTS